MLNTGTISATATTSVNTNSATSADAITIGSYIKIPRIVVSGEATSARDLHPGTVDGLGQRAGGGIATALDILTNASCLKLTCCSMAASAPQITTTTPAPTPASASAKTPFVQDRDRDHRRFRTVKTINNAGSIVALVTQQIPEPNAVVCTITHAIDLLAGTSGGTTINNSGAIQGDIYFNSGGNGNTLNVGNTGTGVGDRPATPMWR